MEASNMLDIKWDEVDKKFKFAAMCGKGEVWLFDESPIAIVRKNIPGFWRLTSLKGSIELYTLDGNSILKEPVHWAHTLTARPVVKMNVTNLIDIDWDDIDPRLKFAAMDEDGWIWLYTECPEIIEAEHPFGYWYGHSTVVCGTFYFLHVDPSLKEQIDWKNTLTERPVKIK